MEEKMIIVSFRKSNRSSNIVCQVSVNGDTEGMQYCTSPLKALRYCFILKKKSGVKIAAEAIEQLRQMHQIQKALANA
jgi:hypothetical protein